MKKALSILLIITLLMSFYITCFAECQHNFVLQITPTPAWFQRITVSGCHNCPFQHDHSIGVIYVYVFRCSKCGYYFGYTVKDLSVEYCPYSH